MSDRPRLGASALLDEPNPWSDWMADYDVERLSWMRLAALQLAQVPFPMVVNRLAAGLAAVAAYDAQIVMEMFEDDPELDGKKVDWAFWLERWHDSTALPYDCLLLDLDHELFASHGTGLIVSGCGKAVTDQAFLWFMLSAIRGWAEHSESMAEVKPGCRWILDLHRGSRADLDPLVALLAHFYERFRVGGYAPTARLPEELGLAKPLMVRDVGPRRARRLGASASAIALEEVPA